MMEARRPYIVAAMDDREESTPATIRSDPTALVYVMFGLLFEALTQSSTSSTSPTMGGLVAVATLEFSRTSSQT
jgi:hypothetical protein